MNRIVFLNMNGEDQVEVKMSGALTWMDITDRYLQFLQGCGFQVTGADVAAYLSDVYGMSIDSYDLPSEAVEDTFAESNTIHVSTHDSYDFSELNQAINLWAQTDK